VVGDFQFIVLEKFLSHDNELPFWERLIMRAYFYLKEVSLSEERGFGLDPTYVTIEKFPLIVSAISHLHLKRVNHEG
jgi:KUP system potassium uptake protein